MSTIARPIPTGRSTAFAGIASVAFLASKATAFLGPMLLARSLPVADYGRFELALAWGTPSAVLLGLGLQGAVPYFLLKLEKPQVKPTFFLHVAVVTAFLGAIAILCRALAFPEVFIFALLVAAIFNGQNIYTALLRTEGQPAWSSFIEVGLYCILFVVVSALIVLHQPVTMPRLFVLLLSIALSYILVSSIAYKRMERIKGMGLLYRDAVVYGMPIILASLLSTLILSGGRILIGAFLGVKDVAIFSILFRISAAAVLVHQLPSTIIFPKLYKAVPKQLNRYLGMMQSAVLCAALFLWVCGWPIGLRIFPLLRHDASVIHSIMLVVALQMFYWCSAAECEFIFYRENRSKRYAAWLCCIFVLLVGGTYMLKCMGMASLISLAQWQMTVMYVTAMGSMSMLWRLRIRLPIPILLNSLAFGLYWLSQAIHRALFASHL